MVPTSLIRCQRNITFIMPGDEIKTLMSKDVTDDLLDECLQIIGHWVDLLQMAIRAECPAWELLQAC